ncbi:MULTISPECIES: hypothetical protein [Arthrobacter]|uniref:Uncharacterized protein n=2 Tax=Arthrobacter TaxID=1663 RepID=A0ABU9KKP6_9MICC|nr:hypothetical protein [Arthrobacter sp. YJM1]MDP5226314.1 hypothetical protein [Arthrobacter sp. YJM1]
MATDVLILRDDAIETIGPLLRPHGELLPLLCEEARLAVFSAPVVEGAVDLEKSDIVRFRDGGILRFRSTVFHEEVVGNLMAFKLSEKPRGKLYLTEPLVEAMLATGMTAGTNFVEAK